MKGIMFVPELFKATVLGIKTQTRRIGGFERVNTHAIIDNDTTLSPDDWDVSKSAEGQVIFYRKGKRFFIEMINKRTGAKEQIFCKYNVGDTLYLKEPYLVNFPFHSPSKDQETSRVKQIRYKYNYTRDRQAHYKWSNKMFMKEEYARYYIEIRSIRVQRLQDISEADAVSEGIMPLHMSAMQLIQCGQLYFDYSKKREVLNDGLPPIESYKSLWQKINKKKCPWENNPWLFVYDYKFISADVLEEYLELN